MSVIDQGRFNSNWASAFKCRRLDPVEDVRRRNPLDRGSVDGIAYCLCERPVWSARRAPCDTASRRPVPREG